MIKQHNNARTYIVAFVITAAIFMTSLYMANFFSNQRLAEIRDIETRIATDILSLETQFELLEGLSCSALKENPVISHELRRLATQLNAAENAFGVEDPEVLKIKRQYSLLQIKDYLLTQRVAEKCGDVEPVSILYFYSNKGDCDDCTREGHVLSFLENKYPDLRVYAFDYNLDIGALQTLITLSDVENNLPALIIEDEIYYGFKDRIEVEEILPLGKLATSTEEEL